MRTSRSLLVAGIVALAATSLGTGCIEDDRTFVITQNQIPQSKCTITTAASIYRPRGTLDVSVKQGYWLYPLLVNNLTSTRSSDKEPERNTLHMRGFDVEIDLGQIPGQFPDDLLKFWEPTSGVISPSGSIASILKAIPDRLVQLLNIPVGLKPLVMISIKATAKHAGGDKESSTFIYPVDLCNGCLVDLRTTCPDPAKDKEILTNYCGTPQDDPITCCTASGKTKCFGTAK